MKSALIAAIGTVGVALPAVAEGDIEAGEKVFRQCQTCHIVMNEAGETLAGKKAKTGPNLYGIAGRTAGTVEDFRYSKFMVSAGEAGLAWDEESFGQYVMDPTSYLKEYLDDSKARGKMAFKLRKEEDAANVWAFITSLAPES